MSTFESVLFTNGLTVNHRHYYTYDASAKRLPCTYVFPTGYCYRRTPSASFCGITCKIIIGSVLGGLALLCLAVLVVYHFRRRKTTQQPSTEVAHISSTNQPGPAQTVPPPQQPMFGGRDYAGAAGYDRASLPMPPAFPGNGVAPLGHVSNTYVPAPTGYGYQPYPPQLGYPLATTQATDGVYVGGATYYARARAAEDTAAAFSASSSGYPHPEKEAS
ncbi:hypothetical protein CGC21_37130 [Leishmania donovani]|uniref:Uncharacterized protein n=1 Tax=Leishmania donovani TaxID=5661 RepID=A0A504XYG6_LEIDO|nr:hypothetical protein CGC21_37110 [Leishmania donovani]TPP53575.1 hypothetical protein CGC21_37130 [Leishmania donovani]